MDQKLIRYRENENEIFKPGKLPVLIYAGQVSNEPEWKFPSHKHDDFCEIIYISKGEGTFIVDNKPYYAKQGDILVYNPGVVHEEFSNPSNPLKTYFCGVGNLFMKGMQEGQLIPEDREPIVHTHDYSYKIESYITDIFEESSSQVLGFDVICQNLLFCLLTLLIRIIRSEQRPAASSSPDSLALQIKQYIDKNYTKNITLNDIADNLYISQYYMSHIFKNETSYSPINYLIHCRIGQAKVLLLTTDLKINEVAKQVGYENSNYFTMLFKKITGESPKQYKEKNKQKMFKHS